MSRKLKIGNLLITFALLVLVAISAFTLINKEPEVECINVVDEIKNKIEWEDSYNEEVEKAIIKQCSLLPEDVLNDWLQIDSKIIVVPDKPGYLDNKFGTTDYVYGNSYTAGCNSISRFEDKVLKSHIYVMNSTARIERCILHEFGHYFYYKCFGNLAYTMPNYDDDNTRYINEEKKGNTYFEIPKEYFAEIFQDTLIDGVDFEFEDTLIMYELIYNY